MNQFSKMNNDFQDLIMYLICTNFCCKICIFVCSYYAYKNYKTNRNALIAFYLKSQIFYSVVFDKSL